MLGKFEHDRRLKAVWLQWKFFECGWGEKDATSRIFSLSVTVSEYFKSLLMMIYFNFFDFVLFKIHLYLFRAVIKNEETITT